MNDTEIQAELEQVKAEFKAYVKYVERSTEQMLRALEVVAERRFDTFCIAERDDDALGALCLGINMMISDVGDAFQKAEEARMAQKRLLESIPDPVYTVNAKKIITYFNKAAEQLTGLEQNEAVGKKCHDVMQFNLCDKSCTIDAARHEHKTVKQDMVLTKSDRQALDICATASYFSATEGKDAGGIVILRDVSEERSRERELQVQMETITRQNKAIEELSTPIIPIMDHILVLPLIGTVDAQRAREIMRALLAAIRKHRAKVVILDITGVAMIDSMVANHLDRTIAAARLKGARTVVTGISESVAETIVDLGIDWSSIETLSDLQTGLFGALHTLGYQLVQKPASSN